MGHPHYDDNNNNNNDDNNNIIPVVLKYWVGMRWSITNRLMVREGSLTIVDKLSSDGVTIKTLVGGHLKTHMVHWLSCG